jgi:PAS domain S-box-containing protein
MEFFFFDDIGKRPYLVPALIVVSSILSLLLNVFGLTHGISYVLPHLFYLPIILTAYYYPKRGILFTVGLSLCYCALAFTVVTPTDAEMVSALARSAVFVIIAAVVSNISGRMHHDTQMCRRLVSVVRSSGDAIISETFEGTVTDWNSGAEMLYGYTSQEMAGHSLFRIIPPDRQEEKRQLMERIRQGEVVERFETERITKDGTHIQISLSLSPIRNNWGEVVGISEIAHDITERQRLQKAILLEKEQWELTFNADPDLIAIIDSNFRVVQANKAMADRLGVSPAEAVGLRCFDVVHHRSTPIDFCPHRMLIGDGQSHSTDIHEENLGGDFNLSVSPIRDPDGAVIGSVHILHDITERKRMETALRESEERYRTVIENIQDVFFRVNRENTIEMASPSALKVFGYASVQDMIGMSILSLWKDPQKREELLDALKARNGAVQDWEAEYRKSDGTAFWVSLTVRLRTDDHGEYAGTEGIIRDISKRKKAEEALKSALKKLNMLSSITRHDILNQIMGLRAFLEISKEDLKGTQHEVFIAKEEQAAEAIQRQIEFTKYYEDIGVNEPRWQDAGELINEALIQLCPAGVDVQVAVSDIEIFADPLIVKVFFNLMENSLRHGERVTAMSFSLRETDDGLVIVYQDNGVGITDDDKQKLFRKGFGKHTGLGLFLSREILAITGISIVENGEPGKGVRFEITVPKGAWRKTGKGG